MWKLRLTQRKSAIEMLKLLPLARVLSKTIKVLLALNMQAFNCTFKIFMPTCHSNPHDEGRKCEAALKNESKTFNGLFT